MPPPGSLLRWIEVVIGADELHAKRIEFPIRKKIAQKGFEGAFMFQKALETNWDNISRIAQQCGIDIAFNLGGEA